MFLIISPKRPASGIKVVLHLADRLGEALIGLKGLGEFTAHGC